MTSRPTPSSDPAGGYTLEIINGSDVAVPSLTATTKVPNPNADMSLVLKDNSGQTVATGTGSRPKALTKNVTTGQYNLVATALYGNGTATLTASYPGPLPTETITYDGNDHATSINDGLRRITETLAPSGRVLRRVVADPISGAVSEDTTFGYDGGSDSPAYSRPTAGGPVTTYVSGDGGLSAIDVAGAVTYELANLHGDAIGTTDAAGTFTAYPDVDEFGVGTEPATRRGWLGAKDRFSEATSFNLIRMGVRLYEPRLGRFLEVDPVEGGSANDYDYVSGDPVNAFDLDGTCVEDACIVESIIAERLVMYGLHKLFHHPKGSSPNRLPRKGPYRYVPPKEKGNPAYKRVRGGGFIDVNGDIWRWDKLHGDHWDVSHKGGGHTNVFPDGRVRSRDPMGVYIGRKRRRH